MKTFHRCLEAAKEERADIVTIGGDLWEDENVTPDTRASVAHELARLEVPVLLVCGNHDPLLPGGHYARTAWPSNVRLFQSDEPTEYRLNGLSIWGVSWTGGRLSADFLDRFAAPADDGRVHILLLHGTAGSGRYASDGGQCPFTPDQVYEAGFALCLAGHLHSASASETVVYPGSPEPLGWSETGRHCYAVIDVQSPEAAPSVRLVDANRRRFATTSVNCSHVGSSAELSERLRAVLDHDDRESVFLRAELTGLLGPDVSLDLVRLSAEGEGYASLVVVDRTNPSYDLDAIADQPTARGGYVRRLRERIEASEDDRERETLVLALEAGLRALDGHEDLV